MRMRTAFFGCVVGLCLAAFSPGWMVAAEEASPKPAAEAQKPAVEIPQYNYDTPLVRYGDMELGLGYFYYYARVSNDKLRMVNRVEGEERKKMMDDALNDILFEHLVVKDAEKNGFLNDPEYRIYYRDMQNDWLTRIYEYLNFHKPYKPKEEDLQKAYEEKKQDYFQQQQFSFRHIFFRTVDLPEDQQMKARERADAALALIKAGSPFVEVAKLYSDSERKGEVIGPMTPSKYKPEKPLNPTLENALLAMKEGDVSDVISTKYGFEILKLETMRPEGYQTLDEVRNPLSNAQRSKDYEQWKKDLLEKYWNEGVKQYNPDIIFAKDADPQLIVFEAFGQAIDLAAYNSLKGQDDKKESETDDAYRQRRIDFLKNTLVHRYVVGKVARDEGYDTIPFYIERIKMMRNFRTYMAWINRLVKKQLEENPNTDAEKKKYFEDNQNRFLKNQTAHIGEMTFNLPPHNKEVLYEVNKAQKAAEEKAKKAIERVKGGEDFAKVAKEMSESETAKNGGDLGVISVESSSLPRMAASQAIGLATGVVCETPIQGDDKYYVVICYDKPPREPRSFDEPEVQTLVDRGLTGQKRSEFHQQLMDKMLDKNQIELLFKDVYNTDPVKLVTPSLNLPSQEEKEETKPADPVQSATPAKE